MVVDIMSNVKLAIRVRPFTERELRSEKDRISVVSVLDEHTVAITNIKVSVSGAGDSRERVRNYFADYTFDSACPLTDPGYASQEKVFETIGREVVSSVSKGVSACVLAYGQSATGKTHTMMGSEHHPGLVPRLCRAIAEDTLDITVSFLEIYNERVHDLLAGEPLPCHSLPRRRGNARKDLRVREHPERGPYVQNLRRVAVTDLETLLSLVEEGARRRHTAATRRNSTSSRSHALLELATPRATLHLADLAGSEKASWEGCGGGRQKEGANINKSLVALSNVISALVSGGNRGRFVPYRDSALTWLLKDCFTGGASTFIIATVSPSVACYGESASTLRWAERARQLRTPRTFTNSPSTANRAMLQAQMNQLLNELAKHHIIYNLQTGKIVYEENHWTLNTNLHNDSLKEESKTVAKIGNILNMFTPKTDAQTSGSTASSVASGSSDVLNTIDKNLNISQEICKEVDKLLTPALERTRSNSDIEVVAPLRRRRHYKSQEVLPVNKTLHVFEISDTKPSPAQSQERINDNVDKNKITHVPILYDNQRAEIVASVTERLYSKLKKKEEAAVSKVESMVDKRIMEPLSELKICTNARQRLMEISQRAIRNKRRIGIPAHTQTRMTVTRVRDQGVDVQTDLETYILRKDRAYILQRDAATETMPMTPRSKEISVGPKHGSMDYRDRSTITEIKQVEHRSSFAMTDIVATMDKYSQTPVVPPPRRKKRPKSKNNTCSKTCLQECFGPPVISINISQPYAEDTESQSSEENVEQQSSEDENIPERVAYIKPTVVSTTPDLLTNHNNADTSVHEESESDNLHEIDTFSNTKEGRKVNLNVRKLDTINQENVENLVLFPEEYSEEFSLPRVTVASAKVVNENEMKDMIMGRNENIYPYNIILSPPKERDDTKRIVKFKDYDVPSATSVGSQTSWEWTFDNAQSNISSDVAPSEKDVKSDPVQFNTIENGKAMCTDSTDSSKIHSDSFIWKVCEKSCGKAGNKNYTPVYKNNSKYRTARTKIYKEFLGLDTAKNNIVYPQSSSDIHVDDVSSSDSVENCESQYNFERRRKFFEDKFRRLQHLKFDTLERNVLNSCRSLETTVNKYENYLGNYHDTRYVRNGALSRTSPRQYLQQLVQLRRDVIRTECDISDSSGSMCRK